MQGSSSRVWNGMKNKNLKMAITLNKFLFPHFALCFDSYCRPKGQIILKGAGTENRHMEG